MASISASIELYDRMSAPLYSMMSAMNSVINTFHTMDSAFDDGFDTGSIAAAEVAMQQMESQMEQVHNQIQNSNEEQQKLNNNMSKGASAADDLVSKVQNLATAYLSMQGIQKVLGVSDELTQTIARLNLMNDGAQTTQELFDKIYLSAMSTHSPLMETANAIAKMGNNAGAAFSSNDELIAFMEQVNKQFVIGGASATEQSNAMMQLSQAMASGALRGDELNSILDAAPGIARTIEKSMGWAEGSIKSYAEEGKVTAEVVKSSLLNMANETNAAFESMPITFSQVMTDFVSSVQKAFQPVLNKINELANNDQFQAFVESAISALATLAVFILDIMNTMSEFGAFIADNWSIIEPIVIGAATAMGIYAAALLIGKGIMLAVAAAQAIHTAMTSAWSVATFMATVQQQGLNAALAACPITWIILLIIAVIAAIFAVCSAIAKMTGVANSGFGVIMGCIFTVGAFFKNLGLTVANIALGIGNALSAVASNMMTAFHNAICSVQAWFYGLLSDALTVIAGIAEALNKLPFVEFDYSGITNAADNYAAKAAEAEGNKQDYTSIGDAFNDGMSTFDTFQDGWASDAFASGAAWGDGVADKVSGMFDGGIDLNGGIDPSFLDSSNFAQNAGNGIADTADNTGKIADSVDISNENLKYLRDMAETEAINRFTTAEITVSAPVTANVASNVDIDGMVDHLSAGVLEAMEVAAEGVHN